MAASTTPARSERRERLRTARREAILSAAREVFAQKGFEGTTIADVAREAGVASGTVYLYFPSKLDIFAALNARLFEVIIGAMNQVGAPPTVRGGTRTRIHAIFESCSEHRDLLRLVFLNPDPRTEVARRMRRADEERLKPLAQIFQQGIAAGTVRQSDPKLLAKLVNGLVITALYQCFVQSDGRDVDVYKETVTEMIVGGLTP
ncbi:MAG: TetR/AcrR family transcriptional regulator [Dehalococcoidia bacterium]